MDAQQTLKAFNSSRPAPVLHELGWFADTPLVRAADRIFGEHADIGLALAIAVALPFLRGALDHFLFKVGRCTTSELVLLFLCPFAHLTARCCDDVGGHVGRC